MAAVIEGDAWRWEQRAKIGLSTAWHTEAYARTKGRLPNLESAFRRIFRKQQRAAAPQTAEQQIQVMRMFGALAEGAEARKKKRKKKGRR